MTDQAEQSLWRFSLTVYERPGIAEACLQLQDNYDIEINILLWAAWLAVLHRHALTTDQIQQARQSLADWQAQVVGPLRSLRQLLKRDDWPDGAKTLRRQIKDAELFAERIAQRVLINLPISIQPLSEDHPISSVLAANLRLVCPYPGAAPLLTLLQNCNFHPLGGL